jgi:hypothetical protein
MLVRRILLAGLLAGSLTAGAAAPAAAQTTQTGLVNVNIEDVTLQLPIAIAANVCDVTVAILVQDLRDGRADCDAEADAISVFEPGEAGGGGPTTQEGLVNVNVSDVTIQVPIAVAANICDVDVLVLAQMVRDGTTTCEADASSHAEG